MTVGEDRDDVAVRVVALVDAVDVEVAEADAFERIELRVREAELFSAELPRAIRRVGIDRMVLADGQGLQFAEDPG